MQGKQTGGDKVQHVSMSTSHVLSSHVRLQEVKSAQAGGLAIAGAKVGHVAHLGGALMGVLLILALSRLPEVTPSKKLP